MDDASRNKGPSTRVTTSLRRELVLLALAAVAIRCAILALDHRPRFFLGDSESYLETAFGRWIPNDRSWIYGLAINALFRLTRSLTSLFMLQSLASAVLCWTVAALSRLAGVRTWVAWLSLLVLSLDPLLLYYDRSIMTDAPAAAAVGVGVVLTVLGMRSGARWSWAASAICLGAAIWLRTAVLPLVLWVPAFAVARGLMQVRGSIRLGGARRAIREHLAGPALLAGLVSVCLLACAIITGRVTRSPPSLNPKAGYFLLGVVAPILEPTDFRRLGVADPAALLGNTHHRERTLRNCQVFCPNELAGQLELAFGGDWRKVSRAGTVLARRSIQRDPIGFARLFAAQAEEYLSFSPYRRQFNVAFGMEPRLTDRLVRSIGQKADDPVDVDSPSRPSPVLSWLDRSLSWATLLCWLALLLPVAAIPVLLRVAGPWRGGMVLLATSIWITLGFLIALSPELVPRYLLPLTPLVVALAALAAEHVLALKSTLW
jgi:hypothetical protein